MEPLDNLAITAQVATGFTFGLVLWLAAWGAQVMFTAFRAVADPGEPDIG